MEKISFDTGFDIRIKLEQLEPLVSSDIKDQAHKTSEQFKRVWNRKEVLSYITCLLDTLPSVLEEKINKIFINADEASFALLSIDYVSNKLYTSLKPELKNFFDIS